MNKTETKAIPVVGKPRHHPHLVVLEVNPGEPEERRLQQPPWVAAWIPACPFPIESARSMAAARRKASNASVRMPSLLASSEWIASESDDP